MNASIDILLVEDDPGDVHLALAVFGALKIADRCVVAGDGEDAMDFLNSQGRFLRRTPGMPRLILLDLKMPRVNGFDFLQKVKANARLQVIPVVALTSSREERDVNRAYDLGVNGYVVKGVEFGEYRATLQALAKYWTVANVRPAGFVERGSLAAAKSIAGNASAASNLDRNPWLWSMPLLTT